jgi:single-stranded-DNA-specific exonuclease
MAVGITLASGSVDVFRTRLDGWARELSDESLWTRSLSVDLELPISALSLELAEELERMGPFGSGNPPVLIAARGARVQRMQRVGSGGKHLSLVLESGSSRLRSIFFQFENRRAPAVGQPVNAVFELKRDQYQGFVNVQGLLRDLVVDSIS